MRIKVFGLALIALLALGALSAAGAGAQAWENDGSPLTAQQQIETQGNIEVEERTVGGARISCAFDQKGKLGPGGIGEITGPKTLNCTYLSGTQCESASAIELEALHLPWKTELVDVAGGALRENITGDGSGAPEWMLKCNGIRGKEEQRCSGAETSLGIKNVGKEYVTASFDEQSVKGQCTTSGSETFVLHGSEKVKFLEAANLTAETSQWLLNGRVPEHSVTVASKGTLKLGDAAGFLGYSNVAECASAEEATVMPGDLSEVTHAKFTGCEIKTNGSEGVCLSGSGVEAQNLPWQAVLGTSAEGTPRLVFVEGSKGAPGFKLTCKSIAGTGEDVCTGNTSALMTPITGGLEEKFDSHAQKLNCSVGGTGKGSIEGTNLIENPAGGTLTFAEQ